MLQIFLVEFLNVLRFFWVAETCIILLIFFMRGGYLKRVWGNGRGLQYRTDK